MTKKQKLIINLAQGASSVLKARADARIGQ